MLLISYIRQNVTLQVKTFGKSCILYVIAVLATHFYLTEIISIKKIRCIGRESNPSSQLTQGSQSSQSDKYFLSFDVHKNCLRTRQTFFGIFDLIRRHLNFRRLKGLLLKA